MFGGDVDVALLRLYFKNSQGKERLIAECKTVKDVGCEINKFLEEHNYKSYYSRSWEVDGRVKIDVGSWSEFFYIEGITYEEYIKELHLDEIESIRKVKKFEEVYHQVTFDEYLENLQNS